MFREFSLPARAWGHKASQLLFGKVRNTRTSSIVCWHKIKISCNKKIRCGVIRLLFSARRQFANPRDSFVKSLSAVKTCVSAGHISSVHILLIKYAIRCQFGPGGHIPRRVGQPLPESARNRPAGRRRFRRTGGALHGVRSTKEAYLGQIMRQCHKNVS